MSGRREKAGLLATVLDANADWGYVNPPKIGTDGPIRLAIDDSYLDMEHVVDEYHAAVQELRVACSTEVAYPEL